MTATYVQILTALFTGPTDVDTGLHHKGRATQGGVHLIRITRSQYDIAVSMDIFTQNSIIFSERMQWLLLFVMLSEVCPSVQARSMQARQLEDLLSFIKKLPPFKRLPRDKLTSIVIFCQPRVLEKGSILATEGDPVNELYMVRFPSLR